MTGSMDTSRISYIVDDYFACGWYRCHVPGMELRRRGHEVVLDHQITPEQVRRSDVIVFQRQWRPEALQAFQYARSLGKTVVYELDDDLWDVPPTNPAYEAWNAPGRLQAVEAMMREADAVTTTTPALARLFGRFSKNVRVLPNMLPPEHWQVQRERRADGTLSIGWAGSTTRGADLAIVKEVVLQTLQQFPQVEMLVIGPDSNMIFPPHERIRQLQPVKIERYPELLAQLDIGLAPVVDNRFNQAKSDLKFVEYGKVGVATVASHVEAYVHSVVQGENGFLAKNPKDWLKYLRRLIEQPELLDEVSRNAKAFAEARTIDKNIGLWERAYGVAKTEPARPSAPSVVRPAPAPAVRPVRTDDPVSIIVLTHNQLPYTQECFQAIEEHTENYELVVVDNASTDETTDYLRDLEQTRDNVTVILNRKNRGFAGGCNQGVRAAKSKIICLLNNDTVPMAGWLDALKHELRPGVGAVGAKLLFPDQTIQHGGIFFGPQMFPVPHFVPDHRFVGLPSDTPEANVIEEVAGVTAACLLMPKRLYKEVGGLDEGFVMANFEDVDLNLKIRDRGLKVIYQPQAVLIHYQHKSIEAKAGQSDDPLQYLNNNLQRLLGRWNEKLLAGLATP